MKCPNPNCDGDLLLNRMRTDKVSDDGVVPEYLEWEEEWLICDECAETPSFSWETVDGQQRVVLGGEPFPAHG